MMVEYEGIRILIIDTDVSSNKNAPSRGELNARAFQLQPVQAYHYGGKLTRYHNGNHKELERGPGNYDLCISHHSDREKNPGIQKTIFYSGGTGNLKTTIPMMIPRSITAETPLSSEDAAAIVRWLTGKDRELSILAPHIELNHLKSVYYLCNCFHHIHAASASNNKQLKKKTMYSDWWKEGLPELMIRKELAEKEMSVAELDDIEIKTIKDFLECIRNGKSTTIDSVKKCTDVLNKVFNGNIKETC